MNQALVVPAGSGLLAGASDPDGDRLRAELVSGPSAGQLVLHLPEHWPWEAGLDELFRRALHDPLPTAA